MMNPEGAVKDMRALQRAVEVVGRGSGHFAFYADPQPRCILSEAPPADAMAPSELMVRTCEESHLENGHKRAMNHLTSAPLRAVVPENWATVSWALLFEW
ncbi:unnamed protein product [Effrenium voratum]|uniref:Uncharacterized protein n=1 Tax=Effrenium voratum TaxID=2562239 RepID=A0AA36MLP3_9DINO|nr:unnamed protein product [Effrenium voratum]CAJ1457550.1 unnamed protein product [Effrenium voratum]